MLQERKSEVPARCGFIFRVAVAGLVVLLLPAVARAAPSRVVWPLGAVASVNGQPPRLVAGTFADGSLLAALTAEAKPTTLVRLAPDGFRDASFGRHGETTLAALTNVEALGVEPLPGGGAYVIALDPTKLDRDAVLIARTQPDGQLDPSFGDQGIVRAAGARIAWAVQPDGKLVLHGQDGPVVRLLSDGAQDPSFQGPTVPGYGAMTVTGDGRILVTSYVFPSTPTLDLVSHLIALRPDGSVDPAFNGGRSLAVQPVIDQLLPRADGSVDLFDRFSLRRLLPDGTPGPWRQISQFGGGPAAVAANGDTYAESWPTTERNPTFSRLGPGLDIVKQATVALGFAGGSIPPDEASALLPVSDQYMPGEMLIRPGGGFLIAGIVSITDNRAHRTHYELGAAAFNSDLLPDRSYGFPQEAPRIALRANRRTPLRVDVVVHAAGRLRVGLWHGRTRIAGTSWPSLGAGSVHVRLPRTAAVTRLFRAHPRARLYYRLTFTSLVGLTTATIARPR